MPPRCVKPGGRLVYSTCSLEPEEGEAQVAAFLVRNEAFRLDPIGPARFSAKSRVDRAIRLPSDLSLRAKARNAGMERDGRLFCHSDWSARG